MTLEATIDEIRNTFSAMIGRLKQDTDEIPDELVGKAKLVQLEIFLAHSKDISDRMSYWILLVRSRYDEMFD